jgi:hypothetical protein
MWQATVILVGYLSGSPEHTLVPGMQECVVVGKIFNLAGEIGANLFSNCPLTIHRKPHGLVMKGRYRNIEVRVPENPGVHEFIYRWGQSTAQIDNHDVDIAFGPAAET